MVAESLSRMNKGKLATSKLATRIIMKREIIPSEIPTSELHQLLVSTIAPRPIAFVSTIDEEGNANLAPYSFFNVFSSNPPIMIFSSNRKVSDNTTKDTLHNAEATKEVVINIVNHDIVRQMAVTSSPFPSGVSEFEKAGLTPVASDLVKPYRVEESFVNYECKVNEIIKLGTHGGAGNLIVCEVVKIHASEHIFDEKGRVVPEKLDIVGRMGRAFYSRAKQGVFRIFQAMKEPSIGYDQLPEIAKSSTLLTGNELGELAGLFELSSEESITDAAQNDKVISAMNAENSIEEIEKLAKKMINQGEFEEALAVLTFADKEL
jgi:flavin reductase (DIM6/NTAB) family NADH-FMN oxidoreductase RutF